MTKNDITTINAKYADTQTHKKPLVYTKLHYIYFQLW